MAGIFIMLVQVAQLAFRAEQENSSAHPSNAANRYYPQQAPMADTFTNRQAKSMAPKIALLGVAAAAIALIGGIPLISKQLGKKIVKDTIAKLPKNSGITADNFKVSVSGFNKIHIQTQNLPGSNLRSAKINWMNRKLAPVYDVADAAKGQQVEAMVNSSEAIKGASKHHAMTTHLAAHILT